MTSAPLPPPLRPVDVAAVVVVEELDVAADGSTAVVARRVIERGAYVTHLHAVSLADRSRPRRLTGGRVRDGWPRISPDGRTVAFVRSFTDERDRPAELCTMALAGGPVRTIAPRRRAPGFGGVVEIAWAPDGRSIAFTAPVDPPRFLVGERPPVGSVAARSPKLAVARRIARADWRWDEEGHIDRWPHLFVVAAGGAGRPRQVTQGDFGVRDITWRPDGGAVAFAAIRGDEADLLPFPKIWAVDVGGADRRAEPRLVLDAAGGARRPAYSPDGRWLAAVGLLQGAPLDDLSAGLLLGPADGTGRPWALGPELDRPWGNVADTDLNGWMVDGRPGPVWSDEATIVGVYTDRGRSLPARWRIDPATGSLLAGPVAIDRSSPGPWADITTHAIAVAAGGEQEGTIAALGTLGGRAMELMVVDLDVDVDSAAGPGGDPSAGPRASDAARSTRIVTRTSFGSAWQRRFRQPRMERCEAPGRGGPIETWIASPADAGDDPLPTIVDIHGGPLGAWAPAPSIEVIMLTGAGYRVVLPNIRGSGAYGAGWVRPQLGDWGGVDADDVHAAVDHVIDAGRADPQRLGALGLSYGGFMVNWLVATSDRFAAAVSENGVTNQVSCWANSDCGPEYCRGALLGDPFSAEGVETLWRQSPLRHVGSVRTPLLLLQAEADLRCPPQDSEQFFVALRHLRRTVEYVLYPEESHVFSASGRPDRRTDRMARVLEWFDRHLR